MRLRIRTARPGQPAQDPTAGAAVPAQPASPAGVPIQAPDRAGAPAPSAAPVSQPGTQAGAPAGPPQPGAPAPAVTGTTPHHVVRRTRAGGAWVGLALSAIVLLLLLVFILENEQQADIGYFGAHGHLPLGVALLLAAVAGALLVLIPGTARIMQLRATARRHRMLDAKAQTAGTPNAPPATPPAGPGDPGNPG